MPHQSLVYLGIILSVNAGLVHACWMLRSSSIGLAGVDLESDIDSDSDELLELPPADILNG